MWRESWPLKLLERLRKVTGIHDLDYRICRRTFGTLIEGDVEGVQQMLGPSGSEVTLRHYKKAVPERLSEGTHSGGP
jgi:hypothetical protein